MKYNGSGLHNEEDCMSTKEKSTLTSQSTREFFTSLGEYILDQCEGREDSADNVVSFIYALLNDNLGIK